MISEGDSYSSFDEFLGEYKQRIALAVEGQTLDGNDRERKLAAVSPAPFLSGTYETCIERAADKTRGGAKFNYTGLLGMELASLSLTVAIVCLAIDPGAPRRTWAAGGVSILLVALCVLSIVPGLVAT